MSNLKKKSLLKYLLITAVVCCPILSRLFHYSWVSSISTIIWLFASLELSCRIRTRKEIVVSGVLFTAGFSALFFGALGSNVIGLLLIAFFGLLYFTAFWVSGRLMTRWNKFPVTLVLPFLWLIGYFLASALRFPSLARLDMMFTDLKTLMYVEAIIGPTGLSFAILWLVSLLRYAAAKRKTSCSGLCSLLFFLLLLPGIVHFSANVTPTQFLRVAYTTGPYVGDFTDYSSIPYEANEKSLEKALTDSAAQGAELLVFSEEAFAIEDRNESRFLALCSKLAKEHSLPVIVGLDLSDTDNSHGGKSENKLVYIGSNGEILDEYLKYNLIPLLESDYVPGDGMIPSHRLEVNGKEVQISFLICYDSNFPEYVSKLDPDTDILFLASWDWAPVTVLHSKLCCTIALQNQVSVLKPTYDGLSVAIDPSGTIFHKSSTDDTGFEQVQIVDMPIRSQYTVTPLSSLTPPFLYAVTGTEIMSGLICMLMLMVEKLKNKHSTPRSQWFKVLVIATMTGSFADALSWILDGCRQLLTVLYSSTAISIIMTIALIGIFISYLTEYVKEKDRISNIPSIIVWVYCSIAIGLILLGVFTGKVFSFENGFYQNGPYYSLYEICNTCSILFGLCVIFCYRKSLTPLDRLISYLYMLLPVIAVLFSIFNENWLFSYPAITLSLMMIYATLQSDKVERLEDEGKIISYRATHDELTGFSNRRALNSFIPSLEATEGTSGVIYIDLNFLKFTNDHFGHDAGDRVIENFAKQLSAIFSANDLFHISGDEFLCLLGNTPEPVFEAYADKLETFLKQNEPPLAAIGVAYGNNRDIIELIKKAETLMYVSKEDIHQRYPEMIRK